MTDPLYSSSDSEGFLELDFDLPEEKVVAAEPRDPSEIIRELRERLQACHKELNRYQGIEPPLSND